MRTTGACVRLKMNLVSEQLVTASIIWTELLPPAWVFYKIPCMHVTGKQARLTRENRPDEQAICLWQAAIAKTNKQKRYLPGALSIRMRTCWVTSRFYQSLVDRSGKLLQGVSLEKTCF
jgi:hypothetical protein